MKCEWSGRWDVGLWPSTKTGELLYRTCSPLFFYRSSGSIHPPFKQFYMLFPVLSCAEKLVLFKLLFWANKILNLGIFFQGREKSQSLRTSRAHKRLPVVFRSSKNS